MSRAKLPTALRQLVCERAHQRCEYCQSSEWLTGLPCEVDHIVPQVQGGPTSSENLCLACAACNAYKGAKTYGQDPETSTEVSLFNPRQQNWDEHFAWADEGTTIVGLSACGRATVLSLKFNQPLAVAARKLWLMTGKHPPKTD